MNNDFYFSVYISSASGRLGQVYPVIQTVPLDETAYIYCESRTPPKWSKNEIAIKSMINGTLILNNVGEEDSGWYTCKGTLIARIPFTAKSQLLVGGTNENYKCIQVFKQCFYINNIQRQKKCYVSS